MAVELRLYNNNTQVGQSLVLPPATVSRVTAILNEPTPAANADRFLAIAWKVGRLAVKEIGAKNLIKSGEESLATSLGGYSATFDADIPDV